MGFPEFDFPVAPPAASQSRDDRAVEAIAAILAGLPEFADGSVAVAVASDEFATEGADNFPVVRIWLTPGQDADDTPLEANGDGTYTVEHVGRFTVLLMVSDEDQRNRLRRLKRLDSVCRRALNDSDLGGTVAADWTRLANGSPAAQIGPPYSGWTIPGEFRYFLGAGEDDRDAADVEVW